MSNGKFSIMFEEKQIAAPLIVIVCLQIGIWKFRISNSKVRKIDIFFSILAVFTASFLAIFLEERQVEIITQIKIIVVVVFYMESMILISEIRKKILNRIGRRSEEDC